MFVLQQRLFVPLSYLSGDVVGDILPLERYILTVPCSHCLGQYYAGTAGEMRCALSNG